MAIEEVLQRSPLIPWLDADDMQEFSIEIPDKEADKIHSGMASLSTWGPTRGAADVEPQWIMQWSIFLPNPTVGVVL